MDFPGEGRGIPAGGRPGDRQATLSRRRLPVTEIGGFLELDAGDIGAGKAGEPERTIATRRRSDGEGNRILDLDAEESRETVPIGGENDKTAVVADTERAAGAAEIDPQRHPLEEGHVAFDEQGVIEEQAGAGGGVGLFPISEPENITVVVEEERLDPG